MLKKKITVLAAIGLCAAGVAAGVSAATVIQKVQSELRPDFTIVVDGQTRTFKNANGETVYPMLYEGTTYLPVRAIGELMGKTVYWYEDEKKIELRSESTTVTDADVIVPSGGGTTVTPNTQTPSGSQGSLPQGVNITLDEAKNIALERAGLTAGDTSVVFFESKLDFDDGRYVYDIELFSNGVEYSAEILASDGTVIEWDMDMNR